MISRTIPRKVRQVWVVHPHSLIRSTIQQHTTLIRRINNLIKQSTTLIKQSVFMRQFTLTMNLTYQYTFFDIATVAFILSQLFSKNSDLSLKRTTILHFLAVGLIHVLNLVTSTENYRSSLINKLASCILTLGLFALMHLDNYNAYYVTRFEKISLIAHVSRFNFSPCT